MEAYKGKPSTDGLMCYACDAAPKKPQTLQQHLQRYHKGQMPKGDCSWLKQYKKDNPNWKSEVPKATKGEVDIDTVQKNVNGNTGNTHKNKSSESDKTSSSMSFEDTVQILKNAHGMFDEKRYSVDDYRKDWELEKDWKDDTNPRAFGLARYLANSCGFKQSEVMDAWAKPYSICEALGFHGNTRKTDVLNETLGLPQEQKENFIGVFEDKETGKEVAFYYLEDATAESAVTIRKLCQAVSDGTNEGNVKYNIDTGYDTYLIGITPTPSSQTDELTWKGNDGFPHFCEGEELTKARKIWKEHEKEKEKLRTTKGKYDDIVKHFGTYAGLMSKLFNKKYNYRVDGLQEWNGSAYCNVSIDLPYREDLSGHSEAEERKYFEEGMPVSVIKGVNSILENLEQSGIKAKINYVRGIPYGFQGDRVANEEIRHDNINLEIDLTKTTIGKRIEKGFRLDPKHRNGYEGME